MCIRDRSSQGSVTSQVLITVDSPVLTTPGSKRPSTGSFRPPGSIISLPRFFLPLGCPPPGSLYPPGSVTPLPGSRKPSCYSTSSALAPGDGGNGLPCSGSAISKSALPPCTSTTALTTSQPTRSPVKGTLRQVYPPLVTRQVRCGGDRHVGRHIGFPADIRVRRLAVDDHWLDYHGYRFADVRPSDLLVLGEHPRRPGRRAAALRIFGTDPRRGRATPGQTHQTGSLR